MTDQNNSSFWELSDGTSISPSSADIAEQKQACQDVHGDANSTALTVITASKPERLSKGFSLGGDGELLKSPGGNLSRGDLEVRRIASLTEFATILKRLTSKQALVYGVPKGNASRVLTRKAFEEAGQPAGVTTRTNDAFTWPDGSGVMMLDYDPAPGADALDRDALVSAIRTVAPGMSDASMLWWASASSCIWKGDEELRGIAGQRLYLRVQDAADIPRAGEGLVDRLWLAGHGHIEISKSGALLERTLVDASVWQQSRLDFAGGAACGVGLDQRRGDPVIIEGEVELIDTRASLLDLAADERARLAKIKLEAKDEARPDADVVRETWVDARVQEMLTDADRSDPDKVEEAESVARGVLETGNLAGDFMVTVEVGPKSEMVPVRELLENRDRYHGCMTRDPLEPEYDGGRLVGRLYLLQARPTLYSFAHGGKTYRLRRAPVRVEIVQGHTIEATAETIELLRREPVTFDFGGQLALVEDGRVHSLDQHALAYHLGRVTQFFKVKKVLGLFMEEDCDPPGDLLKQIISQGELRKLKLLDGVITGPTIRLDGSLLTTPGYDEETRLLFDPMGETVPNVPMHPTLEEARAALDTLMQPFQTFPFCRCGGAWCDAGRIPDRRCAPDPADVTRLRL